MKVFDARNRPAGPLGGEPTPMPGHQADFLASIRTGKAPNAEIGVGFVSTALCHLGNIATRLGRTLKFDPSSETFVGDDEAQQLARPNLSRRPLGRPQGHLNGMSLA